MIGRADEYLVHQTELPLARVVSDNTEWQDRFYFNIHDMEGKFAAMAGLGAFPNRKGGPHGIVQAYFLTVQGGRHTAYFNVRPIDSDRDQMRAGSLSFEVVEPLQAWKLDIADEANGVSGSLVFRARCPLYAFSPIRWQDGERPVVDQMHYTQAGRYEGSFTIGGETYSGLVGMRDRSWGLRDMPRVPVWYWIAAQFKEFCISAWLWETTDGEVIHCDGAIVPEEGEALPITQIEHEIELHDGQKLPKGAQFALTAADGQRLSLTASEIGSIYLGPPLPAWADSDAAARAAAEKAAFGYDQHAQFEMNGETGYGIVEYMFTGGSKRYGIPGTYFGG
ncbi:MAG: hypothetical protein WD379_08260 [Dehalococcoidia bacterium]